jgi:hypothetical protein
LGDDHRAGDDDRRVAQHRPVIRNVCIHVQNEQPLLADLYSLPSASDAGLVCTNVRGLDGKRPVFIDHVKSTFFFPYHVIRFLEIPAGSVKDLDLGAGTDPVVMDVADDADGAGDPTERLPIVVGAPRDQQADDDAETELEIDEGFLQRIRDI